MFLTIVNSGRKGLIPTNPLNRYHNQTSLDGYYNTYGRETGCRAVGADYQHASNKLIVS